MSSIGTGYDLAASTFSPDGRIFQVEYANKAVESSVTVIALGCKKGVLVAVDQMVPSKLAVQDTNTHIMNVNAHIGLAGSGLYPDLLAQYDSAREEASDYLKEFREPVNIRKLAKSVAERVHIFTLGISRPYGAGMFLVSWDTKNGPSINCIDPSGQNMKYYAWAIGKNAQAAKTEIEKLERRDELNREALCAKAIHILLNVRDEGTTGHQIEMAWIGEENGGKFKKFPKANIEAWEQMVRDEIEAMEQED